VKPQVQRLTAAFLAAFVTVALAGGYWAVTRQSALLDRPDNPRPILDERRIRRGPILDRRDAVLAESIGALGSLTRHYPYPALAPVLGYVSPLYGRAGIEAALDDHLHGGVGQDELDTFWRGTVLVEPPSGLGVRLTLDLELQRAADEALAQHSGAAVVLDTATGQLLALASHPAYDANELEALWPNLVAAADAPLLNRATLGLYQPGGALWPLTLAAAATAAPELLERTFDAANAPVTLNGRAFSCRAVSSLERHSLRDSLRLGCPAPFAELGAALGAGPLDAAFSAFNLGSAPSLELPTTAGPLQPVSDPALAAIGQGPVAVTPLRVALAYAALVGGGVMPAPQIILSTQSSEDLWRPAAPPGLAVTAISPEAAARVKELLPDEFITVAYTGTEGQTLAWYLGFAPRDDARQVVVVALLEDGDTAAALRIGQALLSLAQR
jgi:peptidoglycan glycosyltransferase